MENESDIIIYQTNDGLTKVDVKFEGETVWLSLDQMATLFQRDKYLCHASQIFACFFAALS